MKSCATLLQSTQNSKILKYWSSLSQWPPHRLGEGELLEVEGHGIAELLEEVLDVGLGRVLIAESLRLPGLNDGEGVTSELLEQARRNTAGAFLKV